jgi:8-oxo-dGTP pyrophosphatase MutT (NUDIX family)
MGNTVRAAGGVVVFDVKGERLVLVTHRPHYDDWSIPKGKLDSGETDEQCAVREVLEETGLHVHLHEELPAANYIDHKGRPKYVRYWRMTVDPQQHGDEVLTSFVPNDEVDEVRWLPAREAQALLHYEHDRALVFHLFPESRN